VGLWGKASSPLRRGWDAKPPGPRIPSLETSKGRSVTCCGPFSSYWSSSRWRSSSFAAPAGPEPVGAAVEAVANRVPARLANHPESARAPVGYGPPHAAVRVPPIRPGRRRGVDVLAFRPPVGRPSSSERSALRSRRKRRRISTAGVWYKHPSVANDARVLRYTRPLKGAL
jgi:hypothetical protein